MPAKKTKPQIVEPEVKPIEIGSPVVVEPAAVEPPTVETPAAAVKEGELASAIADLAKAVDNTQPKTAAGINPPVVENKEFEPVGVSVEPNPQPEIKAAEEKLPAKNLGSGKKGQGLWVVLAFLIGLGAGVMLGYWLWGRGAVSFESGLPANVQTGQKVTPTAAPATQTTPAAVKVDRSKLKVRVLNGTGGKGVAASAKEELEKLGYVNVEVGNADREDYEETEIAIKESMKTYFETLKADLAETYKVASEASTLAEGSSLDAVVTIGSE